MGDQVVEGVPELRIDDGAVFIFEVAGVQCGFMHRPVNAPELVGGTVTPPVKWTMYDNLGSWVESVKHGARNNSEIRVVYDDAISSDYNSWSYSTPSGGGGFGFGFQQVYAVTG